MHYLMLFSGAVELSVGTVGLVLRTYRCSPYSHFMICPFIPFSPHAHSFFLPKVMDEVKVAERRRSEETNAELSNPYAHPFNPFVPQAPSYYPMADFQGGVDPDLIQAPPPNPYTSSIPRFDPDSSWSPPPNPYAQQPI